MRGRGPRLARQVGLVDATGIALGAIIGAGVFVVMGEAARVAGSALPLAVLLAAGVAFCNGLSAAELGAGYPDVGGPYEFGYELISPVVGFAGGWIYLFAYLAANTTFALAFASYMQVLAPGLPPRGVAVGLAVLALAINLVGVRQSGRVNDVLVGFRSPCSWSSCVSGWARSHSGVALPSCPSHYPGWRGPPR